MQNRGRGDTIIEVMFATAVAGLIIVLSMAVMNRGVATAQMSLEHTLVRQAMDGQADALRYIRDTADDGSSESTELWEEIKNKAITGDATDFSQECDPTNTSANNFYIKTSNPLSVEQYTNTGANPFAEPNNGLWIEAVKPSTPNSRFIDFHIRACWDPPFSGPKASIGTIVRLYD